MFLIFLSSFDIKGNPAHASTRADSCGKEKRPLRIHELKLGDSITLLIRACERISQERLHVASNARYIITCDTGQTWIDWTNRTCSLGYRYKPAEWVGQRVPEARTFALCGAYNKADERAFYIGDYYVLESSKDDVLYFFANDVSYMYWNNKGCLKVTVYRKY